MVGVTKCLMCKKSPRFKTLAHILDANVKVQSNANEMISYFEAMQQLTGWTNKLEYERAASHRICNDCQIKVRNAVQIRNEIIDAFDTKNTKSVEVYQIINIRSAKQERHSDDDESKLVEITEVDDDFNLEQVNSTTTNINTNKIEMVYIDELKEEDVKGTIEEIEIFEAEEIDDDNDENDDDGGPMDAVSFLLEKRELFKEEEENSNNKTTKGSGQRRIHKCDVEGCEKVFMRKSNLVDHLRLHAQIRNYKCEFCGKLFVQAGNYRSHLRIHTKERPYKCSICEKTYNQSSALKVHIRSHTNEKNYVCPTDGCLKAFTNSSDLNKHRRIHDPNLKIKCSHCDRSFAQRINLKNHITRHHTKK